MRNQLYAFLLGVFLLTAYNGSSQYYDGLLDMVVKLGYEPGTNSYAILGAEGGLGKYLSFGMSFKYLASYERTTSTNPFFTDDESRFAFSLRADIHGFYLLGLERSDILVGYNRKNGASGIHAEYRYFFSEFFALYGRTKYHFSLPKITSLSDKFLERKLRLEIGFLFKTFSGKEYSNKDW